VHRSTMLVIGDQFFRGTEMCGMLPLAGAGFCAHGAVFGE